MKNKILFLGLFALLAISLYSFSRPSDAEYYAAGGTYRYNVTDTISNAEIDTVTFPVNFISLYTALLTVPRTQLSGTANTTIYIDESALTSGLTDWKVIDTLSGTGATVASFTQDELRGLRYRVRIAGTGTQSLRYTLNFVGKKKN